MVGEVDERRRKIQGSKEKKGSGVENSIGRKTTGEDETADRDCRISASSAGIDPECKQLRDRVAVLLRRPASESEIADKPACGRLLCSGTELRQCDPTTQEMEIRHVMSERAGWPFKTLQLREKRGGRWHGRDETLGLRPGPGRFDGKHDGAGPSMASTAPRRRCGQNPRRRSSRSHRARSPRRQRRG